MAGALVDLAVMALEGGFEAATGAAETAGGAAVEAGTTAAGVAGESAAAAAAEGGSGAAETGATDMSGISGASRSATGQIAQGTQYTSDLGFATTGMGTRTTAEYLAEEGGTSAMESSSAPVAETVKTDGSFLSTWGNRLLLGGLVAMPVLNSLAGAGTRIAVNKQTQDYNMAFQQQILKQRQTAFEHLGLPKDFASLNVGYTPPRVSQYLGGFQYQESQVGGLDPSHFGEPTGYAEQIFGLGKYARMVE